ncbi:hypothetical protein GCM10010399_74410 [Dactylosporangium fulvum]|uniref:Ig-like domain repeat protein n=1 Tax=Dactylosporangium fulvum TaxID=53359 RepID=UPI0031DEA5BE
MKGPKSLLAGAVVMAATATVAVVGLAAPAHAADLGTLTLSPTQGLTTTNPALSATTSAPCPAGYGTNAGLKIGKVGSGDYRNLARVGDAGNYDQAVFTLDANRALTAAYGGTPLADGDYEIAVLCTSETQGDHPDLFKTVITVTGESWQVKGSGSTAADTTTSLTAGPAGPQVAGTPVTLTATVTATAAGGTVEFRRGATSIGTAPVTGGTATLTVSNLPVGALSLSAAFVPANPAAYKPSASVALPYTITAPAGTITSEQTITGDIAPGAFSLNVAGTSVALTGGTVGGQATGSLNKATVVDLRGTNAGWDLVGQVGDFTGAGTIPGSNLGWAPSSTKASGSGAVVTGATAAPGAGSGLGDPRTLCKAASGSSAGTFECGAGLTLVVPDNVAPGTYSATLTLTLA